MMELLNNKKRLKTHPNLRKYSTVKYDPQTESNLPRKKFAIFPK